MKVKWTDEGLSDLVRLYEFLEPLNLFAAQQIIHLLTKSAKRLSKNPRIGIQLQEWSSKILIQNLLK